MSKKIYLLIAIQAMISAKSAFGDGGDTNQKSNGENGVNRRVVSPNGYGGVAGIFSEPTHRNIVITMAPNGSTLKVIEKDVPQAYLGVTGSYEVDAGLTWEKDQNFHPVVGLNIYDLRGKWSMFFRPKGGDYIPISHNFKQISGIGSTFIQFYLSNKKAVLRWHNSALFNNVGTFAFPLGDHSPKNALSVRAKRVIALTQMTEINYNKAEMSCSFSGGKVAPLSIFNVDNARLGTYIPWSAAVAKYGNSKNPIRTSGQLTSQYAPHYYPFGRKGASKKKGLPRVIDTTPARLSSGGPSANLTLFDAELVKIELGSGPRAKGVPKH